MESDDNGGSAAREMKKYLDRIMASSFKNSSRSASVKQELVTNTAARFSLGDSLAMEAVQACSGDKAFKRVLDLLISSLLEEAKELSVTETSTKISKAVCHLIIEHKERTEHESLDMMRHASKSLDKALKEGEQDECRIISESMISVARIPLADTQRATYIPALILAGKVHAMSLGSDASTNSEETGFRRQQVDLLGRRLFALGSSAKPATSWEINLAAPLIASLAKVEFDGTMIRAINFKISVDRPSTMESLHAFFDILLRENKGDYLENHLGGSTNFVRNAIQTCTDDGSTKRGDAVAVLRSLAQASPSAGTAMISEQLSKAIKNMTLSSGSRSCVVDAYKQVALGLLAVRKSGTAVDDSGWRTMAEKYAFPSIDKSGANAQLVHDARDAWMELTNSSPSSVRATVPGAVAERGGARSAKPAARRSEQDAVAKESGRRPPGGPVRPGAEFVPSDPKRRLSIKAPPSDESRRSERERAKASASVMSGSRSSEQDEMAKKRGRRGASSGPVPPGAEYVSPGSQMDERISAKQQRGSHSSSTPTESTHDDDRPSSQRERAKASVSVVSGSPGTKRKGKDDPRAAREAAKNATQESNAKATRQHEKMLENRGARGNNGETSSDFDGHDSFLGAGLSRLDNRINAQVQRSGGRILVSDALRGGATDFDMGTKISRDSKPDLSDDSDGPPRIEVSRGIANDGGIAYGRLPLQRREEFNDEENLAVAIAVNDDDSTFIPSAIQYDPEKKPPIYQNRRFRLYMCTGCLLLIMILVAVSLAVSRNVKSIRNDDGFPSTLQTDSPVMAPTPVPTTVNYQDIIGEISKLTDVALLNDITTPQGKAYKWIQEDDPAKLQANDEGLLRRYALVTMYYSLQENGPWATCGEDDTSHQNPILCIGRRRIFTSTQGTDEVIYEAIPDEGKWLSSDHECSWFGVYCEQDQSVVILEIIDNNLAGTLPPELSTLTFLEYIRLPFNKLRGPLPEWFSEYRQLSDVELHFNQFTGPIPEAIYDRSDFERINFATNMLSGTISTRIGELVNLKGFFIQENKFSGTLPTELGLLSPDTLAFTRWYENKFSGTLPTEIGKLQKLRECWFFNMGLSGEIPTEIGLLHDIEFLRLESNKFTGKIPEEVYNNIELTNIYLSNNALTGTLSSSITKLVDIKEFVVKSNLLTGPIPNDVSNLKSLSMFWIYFNKFSGSVPSSVCGLTFLSLVDLSADCYEGKTQPPRNECTCCTACCESFDGGLCYELN